MIACAALAGLYTGAIMSANAATSAPSRDSGTKIATSTMSDQKDTHSCKGQNTCKGQGGCKSGDNGCKGKNSCKGKGGCSTKQTPTPTP